MKIIFYSLMAVFLFVARPALAETCQTPSFEERYKRASAIFIGEVIYESGLRCGYKEIARFKVIEPLKGIIGKEIYLGSADYCHQLNMHFEEGATYLVYASQEARYGEDRRRVLHYLNARECGGTSSLKAAPEEDLYQLRLRKKQIADLDALIKQNPEALESLLRSKAELLLMWQDYAEAEDALRQLRQITPKSYFYFADLMRAFIGQRKTDDAWALHQEEARSSIKENDKVYQELLGELVTQTYTLLDPIDNFHLNDVTVKDVQFAGRNFVKSNVVDVTFIGGDFRKSIFKDASFKNTVFEGSNLSDASLKNASMENVRISGDFDNADLSGVNAEKLDFMHYMAPGVSFRGAYLVEASFYKLDVRNSDFTKAKLINCNLFGADFSKAKLDGVSLEGSKYCNTQWPKGFDPKAAGAIEDTGCPP